MQVTGKVAYPVATRTESTEVVEMVMTGGEGVRGQTDPVTVAVEMDLIVITRENTGTNSRDGRRRGRSMNLWVSVRLITGTSECWSVVSCHWMMYLVGHRSGDKDEHDNVFSEDTPPVADEPGQGDQSVGKTSQDLKEEEWQSQSRKRRGEESRPERGSSSSEGSSYRGRDDRGRGRGRDSGRYDNRKDDSRGDYRGRRKEDRRGGFGGRGRGRGMLSASAMLVISR